VTEDLWIEGPDDLTLEPTSRGRGRATNSARHIGCPLSWFVQVFPVVRGKNELAVALYLYRLRTIQRSRTVRSRTCVCLPSWGSTGLQSTAPYAG
jgi:hypothetical protein